MWGCVNSGGNTVEPLIDGEAVYSRIGSAIGLAQHSICIAAWDLALDASLGVAPSFGVGAAATTLEDALLSRALHGVRIRIIVWRPAPQLPTLLCPIASAVSAFSRRCHRLSLPVSVLSAADVVPNAALLAPLDDSVAISVVLVSGPGGVLSAHHEKIVLIDPDCPAHTVAFVGVR